MEKNEPHVVLDYQNVIKAQFFPREPTRRTVLRGPFYMSMLDKKDLVTDMDIVPLPVF
jgi:hypothetical protein